MAELNRVIATPLAICNDLATIRTSSADCAMRIHPALPVQDVTLLADPEDYAHKSVGFNLGSLGIAIGLGSPFRYQVDDHKLSCFHLSFGGQAFIEIGAKHFEANLERPAIYLPGEAYRCEIHQPHGLVITTQVERLAAEALLMAEQAGLDGLDLSWLQRPLAIGPTRMAHSQLLKLMRKTLSLLDWADATQGLAPSPGLDSASAGGLGPGQDGAIASLICRQIAAMVYPQLVEDPRR